jgi:pimeloyl-ACP methyl ester carboxylesterase
MAVSSSGAGFVPVCGAPLYDGDMPDILASADLLHHGIAGARKVVLPGVAHVPNMERPEQFNRLVLDFLG